MSFSDIFASFVVFFFWFMAIWIFIAVFADIFRRNDIHGLAKAGWIVLIFLILMHSGKDAGLSGAFGVGSGQGPLGGGSLVERNLNRWTIAFAILFAVNTIVLIKKPW